VYDKETLVKLLTTPLPSKRVQRRANYRPTKEQMGLIYDILNDCLFEGKLKKPTIYMRSMKFWGLCSVYDDPKIYSIIRINNECFCLQWFILILAHEMVHQHQWEIDGPEVAKTTGGEIVVDHTESFLKFTDKFAEHGLSLKEAYSKYEWFTNQNIANL
jgi:hypothetical protein